MKAAERLDLARKLAGIGGDEGAGACIDQGGRDSERRALVASGGERRNDLQNRPAGKTGVRAAERSERAGAHFDGLGRDARRQRLTKEGVGAKPRAQEA